MYSTFVRSLLAASTLKWNADEDSRKSSCNLFFQISHHEAVLTSKSKLNHPEVHNMGDAGYILFGVVGREVLSAGTVIFAVFATGGQLLAGQIALGVLSDSKLCLMLYTGIFAIPTLIFSFPRTLGNLSWLCIPSVLSILIAGSNQTLPLFRILNFAAWRTPEEVSSSSPLVLCHKYSANFLKS